MLAQVKDPFIAKYLKSVGVHLAFLPVSEVVWVVTGGIMAAKVYVETGDTVAAGIQFAAVVAFFQIIPISPGSICRGLYVAYLMVRERNFKDYAVAAPLSFVKVVGYLAFPIQMATVYPELSRFMAGRWATDVVHIIPVFGEKGALLEHYVFDWLFNRSRLVGQRIGRHIRGLLTLLMGIGLVAGGYVLAHVDWQSAAGVKTGVNTIIGVLCLCVLPRVLFYPLLRKSRDRR